MRAFALLLIFQTVMIPVLPWSMDACKRTVEACMAKGETCTTTCCMVSCGGGSTPSTCSAVLMPVTEVPEGGADEEQCPWCPFLACTYGNVPMPTPSTEFALVVPSTGRTFAVLNSSLLAPVLDETWHPPEVE